MVAVVVLSPEETEIAVFGALQEPRYRPFPGSVREDEPEEEWERGLVLLDEAEYSAAVADSDIDDSPGFPTNRNLPRFGAAQRWRRSARESALLVVRRDDRFRIIALGTVEGSSRAPIQGVRRLEIRVRYVLRRNIPFDDIRAALDARQQTMLDDTLAGELRPLSPRLGSSVMTVLTQLVSDLVPVLRTIRDQVNAEVIAQELSHRSRPAVMVREAASSALHFFGAGWHLLEPVPNPAPSNFALELEQLSGTTENDFITDDSAVFPGWERSAYSRGGWWEFRNKGRRLLVKNINVSPQENRTGADLVLCASRPGCVCAGAVQDAAAVERRTPYIQARRTTR